MTLGPSAPLAGPGLEKLKAQAQTARLHKTARQFEALFVTRLLEQMNKTTLSSGLFGKGVEKDIYQSFMNDAVAEKVSARGGMGIAALLERTLARKDAAHPGDPGPGAARPGGGKSADVPAAAPSRELERSHFGRVSLASQGEEATQKKADLGEGHGALVTPGRDIAPPGLGSLSAQIEMELTQQPPEEPIPARDLAAAASPRQDPARGPHQPVTHAAGSAPPPPARAGGQAGPAVPVSAPARSAPQGAAFAPLVEKVARESGVEPNLLHAVLMTESGGRVRAHSQRGAQGLMQLMPDTARAMGVRDVFDPMDNLRGGARYLAQLLKRFGGSVAQAVAAYNAGPSAVEKHGGVPPFPETRHYVREVLARRHEFAEAGRAKGAAARRFE